MRYYFILLVILFFSQGRSQTVLLLHDVNEDVDTETGPGKVNHQSGYISFGSFIGPSESDSLSLHKRGSIYMSYGYYNKWQPTRFFALGMQSGFDLNIYRINQGIDKAFIISTPVKKEHFWQLKYGIQPFMRLNYAIKRGDHHGVYTDLGGYLNYAFITRHSYRVNDPVSSSSSKIVNRNLDFVNRLQYGAVFKIGLRGLNIFAKYRLNDLFKANDDGFNPTDLPKIVVGLQIMG